jgi:amidase/aspartyl-tRNA(Asn)/glutamyl-tRNA(Gln) amidotransferase subunit A
MNLAAWQDLADRDPALAAATLLQRLRALPPAQQRAIVSWQPDAAELAAAFARQTARPGPLSGVPYFAKDLFPVRGVPMHAGSGFLAEIQPAPTQDAALVSDLAGCGGVLAGTAHLHEFAYGLTGDNPHWGNVDIPGRPGRTPGGSSSGSAALVAAGVVPLALGTDTGGSVRVPAAYCGLYGFRTTPGSRWISDAFPLAPGFDTAGWFTRSAEDMLQVKTALLGAARTERSPRGAYLGFADWAEPDPGVAEAIDEAARRFAPAADAMTREQLIRGFRGSSETYATLQSIEAYGVHADWLDRYRDRYGSEVWQRLDRGRRWTDLERDHAIVKQTALRLLWTSFFLTYDYLVLPATPFAAPLPEQRTIANRQRILALTTPASVGGLPVLTIPVPLADGLSTGLQIVVNHPNSPVVDWALQQAGAERR